MRLFSQSFFTQEAETIMAYELELNKAEVIEFRREVGVHVCLVHKITLCRYTV